MKNVCLPHAVQGNVDITAGNSSRKKPELMQIKAWNYPSSQNSTELDLSDQRVAWREGKALKSCCPVTVWSGW